MHTVRKGLWFRLAVAGALSLGSLPAAQAGIFGALNDIANAAQDSGVSVPSSVYAAGSVAQDLNDAARQVTPTPRVSPDTACPPGYSCTPQRPPVCPPGEVCTPVAEPSAAVTALSGTGNLPGLDYPALPQEQRHQANPRHYIHFVMPTQAFVSAHDPIIETLGHPGHYRRFEVSQNNRDLPYLSPATWQRYIVETYRLWPEAQRIPTEQLLPGDPHGGLYRITPARYRFFTRTAVSFSMGSTQAVAKIAEARLHGQKIPNLWVMLDPDCTLSADFYRQALAAVNAGTIDVHVVVVGLDAGSPGRAEAILSSRVPGAHGAGVGEMAALELAQNYDHFDYASEQGGVSPMHGDAAARHLVRVNDRLAYAVASTYDTGAVMIAYPTMLFRYGGQDYLYTNLHSSPIWYTQIFQLLTHSRP